MTQHDEATAPLARSKGRTFVRVLGWGGAAVGAFTLILATLYLAVVAVLWHSHVTDLEGARNNLIAEFSAQRTLREAGETELEQSQRELDAHVATIVDLANDKAQAEDQGAIFRDLASTLSMCSSDMGELMQVYYTWSSGGYSLDSVGMWRYHADLSSYCENVSATLTDQIAIEADGA
jgi:hypothetical protein